MSAAKVINLVIEQGTTYTKALAVETEDGDAIDLSTSTFRAKMRKGYGTSNSVSFIANATNPTIGELTLTLEANTSSNTAAGRYVYDVERIDSNVVSRLFEGMITLNPEVS